MKGTLDRMHLHYTRFAHLGHFVQLCHSIGNYPGGTQMDDVTRQKREMALWDKQAFGY
jgi:hypothetical protein